MVTRPQPHILPQAVDPAGQAVPDWQLIARVA